MVVVSGYDEPRQAFRILNSWGRGWGDKGYAWLDYKLIPIISSEAAVLRVPKPEMPVPTPPVPHIDTNVEAILQQLQCSKLQTRKTSDGTTVSGFVASDNDLATIRSAVAGNGRYKMGPISVAPWPQCEALQTLDRQLSSKSRPAISISGGNELQIGAPLRITVLAPHDIGYLYVSYIQADGSVLHLVQPKGLVPRPVMPSAKLTFGDGADGGPKLTIARPTGREMVIALFAKSPLFEREQPQNQTDRDFLSELRRALVYRPTVNSPERLVAADVVMLQIRE